MLVAVENWNACRKGHSEIFTLTDHRVTKNSLLNMVNLCSLLNRQLQDMARLMYKVESNICPKYIAVRGKKEKKLTKSGKISNQYLCL